ncbi:MAG: EamA family transporter [Motiliproteus sp.]|nr:EamA family transporter [Motiliproteus sp.]
MSVPIAYLTVIVVWSTTPLTVVWSSESINPIMAAFLRMAIAAVVGSVLLKLWRIPLQVNRTALTNYAYAVLGIYGAMLMCYLASVHIPSGLISLIFGLTPMISGLMARFWLNEPGFTPVRWLALLIALTGLGWVMSDSLVIQGDAMIGVLLLFIAVALFSASGVLIKGTSNDMHPLSQTVGALWLSLPFYLLTWYLMDGQWPQLDPSNRSFWAVLYLAIFGSLLGFVSYFHVLKSLSPTTVALVTLITPVIALSLGNWLNQEPITPTLLQGAALICLGLALYHWGERLGLLGSNRLTSKEWVETPNSK